MRCRPASLRKMRPANVAPSNSRLSSRCWECGRAASLPKDSPLLAAMSSVDSYLGNSTRQERSSTDANLPLSMGIPAIAIGGGGQGGGSHSLDEWYDPTDRITGLKRILLTTLVIAQSKL